MSNEQSATMRRLIDQAANDTSKVWKQSTRDTFVIDANAVLEALLLEYGVEATLKAVAAHGFRGNYRPVVEPLLEVALRRHSARIARQS